MQLKYTLDIIQMYEISVHKRKESSHEKFSETRRGIQPTVPISDATLNDSNVNKFVLPGCVQCTLNKKKSREF